MPRLLVVQLVVVPLVLLSELVAVEGSFEAGPDVAAPTSFLQFPLTAG